MNTVVFHAAWGAFTESHQLFSNNRIAYEFCVFPFIRFLCQDRKAITCGLPGTKGGGGGGGEIE